MAENRSRRRSRLRAGTLAVVLLCASSTVAACSGESVLADRISISVEMSSVPTDLHLRKVGPEGSEQYGFGILHGETMINGSVVQVELQCGIDYLNGNGPFVGYWTFTFPNGDVLAFDYEGDATNDLETGVRSISGMARVIGGTGALVDASGSARVSGSSSNTSVGKMANYDIVLNVKGI